MAVPFNMPEDQNEVEVLLIQLQTLLNRLQVVVRQNQQLTSSSNQHSPSTSSIPARVRNPSSSRARIRDAAEQSTTPLASQAVIPDLLSNLSLLTSANESSSPSPLTDAISRSPRTRTISESSNYEETKISITAIVKHGYTQDWNKIDCVDESKILSTDSLLSKIMPASVSSCSLMTAMICFVGWHIFRAR